MQKHYLIPIALIFIFGAINVNANDHKSGSANLDDFHSTLNSMDFSQKPSSFSPIKTVGYANIMGLLQENRWYWVSPGNLAYQIGPNDIEAKYESSELYEEPTQHTFPMQFVKVGEKYLPALEIHYRTLSANPIALDNIDNLTQYKPLLDKGEIVYIDPTSGQPISRAIAAFGCHYIYIRKVNDTIEAVEIRRLLSLAISYSYYPSGKLRSKTTYTHSAENVGALIVESIVYQDNEKNERTSNPESHTFRIQDIPNEILRPLFSENIKLTNI